MHQEVTPGRKITALRTYGPMKTGLSTIRQTKKDRLVDLKYLRSQRQAAHLLSPASLDVQSTKSTRLWRRCRDITNVVKNRRPSQ